MLDPVTLTADLIACPSVTPRDAGALDVLATALESIGFAVDTFWSGAAPDGQRHALSRLDWQGEAAERLPDRRGDVLEHRARKLLLDPGHPGGPGRTGDTGQLHRAPPGLFNPRIRRRGESAEYHRHLRR